MRSACVAAHQRAEADAGFSVTSSRTVLGYQCRDARSVVSRHTPAAKRLPPLDLPSMPDRVPVAKNVVDAKWGQQDLRENLGKTGRRDATDSLARTEHLEKMHLLLLPLFPAYANALSDLQDLRAVLGTRDPRATRENRENQERLASQDHVDRPANKDPKDRLDFRDDLERREKLESMCPELHHQAHLDDPEKSDRLGPLDLQERKAKSERLVHRDLREIKEILVHMESRERWVLRVRPDSLELWALATTAQSPEHRPATDRWPKRTFPKCGLTISRTGVVSYCDRLCSPTPTLCFVFIIIVKNR